MRTYFFGDIHGNLPALEACLDHMKGQEADAVYCLGDIAGWLPFGDRTYARLRSEGFPTVAGNHDLLIAGAFTDHPHLIDRMQATAYNAGLLFPTPGAIDYLLGLPLAIETDDFTVVHHSPFSLPAGGEAPTIASFGYLDDAALAEAVPAWRQYPRRLIVSGHDHVPAVFELPDSGDVKIHGLGRGETSLTVKLERNSRYWVKAGSVGGPYRDATPLANSVLYDSDARTVTLFRIAFDTSGLFEELSAHRFCRNLPTIKKYIETLRTSVAG
ncbi:MAG: metallophosphoesterase family protein [Syntrophobacteraceae bacterium]